MVKLANQTPSRQALPLADIVWSALEKVSSKQKNSGAIADGSCHKVKLRIEAEIDGQPFQQSLEVVMSVGHQQTRSSSVNPQMPELLAWVLSKLNRATRSRILNDIPREFSAQGGMPVASPVLVDEAKGLLKQLRREKTVTARGAIRCETIT